MTDAASINARTIAEFRANPVMYPADRGRYLVFAFKAGSDRNPDWYHNLLAHSDARIEVGEETLAAHASVLRGDERDEAFAEQARRYPGSAR